MIDFEIPKDIENVKYNLNLTDTALAENLGVPRASLHRWKNGNIPSKLSCENFYQFVYRSGIKLNSVKESFFKDAETTELKILFHGSKEQITGDITFEKSKETNDFGKGFYLSEGFSQSASFVSGYPNSSVYVFSLDLKGLKMEEYEVDEDWMLTVALFRNKLETYQQSNKLKQLRERVLKADVIKAPIADNRMFQILEEFIEGNITDRQCKSALSASPLGMQYVIVSEKALKKLNPLHRCYLCNEEKNYYLERKKEFNTISSQKVKFVKREFAGKGLYIDEMFNERI